MGFWNEATAQTEPVRNFRFKLTMTKLGGIEVYAKKVSKPSFTIQETSHKFMNHTFYYPGRTEWNTITFSIVDTVEAKNAEKIMQAVVNSGYNLPTDEGQARKTQSKHSATENGLGDVKIQSLKADGSTHETWLLKNAWVKDVKFGEYDYESDDLTQIDVEVRYDYALFE